MASHGTHSQFCLGSRLRRCIPPCVRPSRRQRRPVQALLKPADGTSARWRQTTDEVFIELSIGEGTKGRDVEFELHPTRLSIAANGKTLLQGNYDDAGEIEIQDSFWNIEDVEGKRTIVVSLMKQTMGHESFEMLFESDFVDKTITQWAYMDFVLRETDKKEDVLRPLGRVFWGMYGNAMPLTVERFLNLCVGNMGEHEGELLWYRGTRLHTIIPGGQIEGGDVLLDDGNGRAFVNPMTGESEMPEEKAKIKFLKKGLLGMSDTLFCISMEPRPDSKVPVIGAAYGDTSMNVLNRLAEVAGSADGIPVKDVLIADCGMVDKEKIESLVKEEKSHHMLGDYNDKAEWTEDKNGDMKPPPGPSVLKPANFRPIDFGDK